MHMPVQKMERTVGRAGHAVIVRDKQNGHPSLGADSLD
jgi:hypothetical protein